MNRTAGLSLIIALSVVWGEQSSSYAQHHNHVAPRHVHNHHRGHHAPRQIASPLQRAQKTVKSTIQHVAHTVGIKPVSHSHSGQSTYCPTCQQHHGTHSHAVRGSSTFKQRTVKRVAKTKKTLGSKMRRFSEFMYAENQKFRTRNLTQSVALFSDKELLRSRINCPECASGTPHYLANNHLPKYPHAEPFQVDGGYIVSEQNGTASAVMPKQHKSHFKVVGTENVQEPRQKRGLHQHPTRHVAARPKTHRKSPHSRRRMVKTTLVPVSETRVQKTVPRTQQPVAVDQMDEFKLPVKRSW